MKKKIYPSLLFLLGLSNLCYSQVGINTTHPLATLDIVGNPTNSNVIDGLLIPKISGDQLKAKDSVYTLNQNGTLVYVTDAVSAASPKTINVTSAGYYYYDAPNNVWTRNFMGDSGSNGTVLYAARQGNWSLISLGISGTNWEKTTLTGTDTMAGTSSLLNLGVYSAPKSGIYEVDFEIQLQDGVDLSILSGKMLGIFKNNNVLVDSKVFEAVRVSILFISTAIPVTSTTLRTFVKLNAGETITFAIETGGADLTVLGDHKESASVFKVSDF